MPTEIALSKFTELVQKASAAFRDDFKYSEEMARHAGTLLSRKENKRQKAQESSRSEC